MSNEELKKKIAENEALHIADVIRSYGRMQIRRASEDKTIEISTQDDGWEKKLEDFCKGTDGYINKVG